MRISVSKSLKGQGNSSQGSCCNNTALIKKYIYVEEKNLRISNLRQTKIQQTFKKLLEDISAPKRQGLNCVHPLLLQQDLFLK